MSQSKRLTIVLALNLVMIVGLVIVGLSSHSLGVLAAGGDYIADSTAIGLGLLAIHLRDRGGGGPDGRAYATRIVAGLNASVLLIVTVFVSVEAARRLLGHSPEIHGLSVLIVSTVATVVMIAGALVLQGDDGDDDLHMRSVVLDTIADAVSAGAVAITGAVFLWSGRWYWLDAAVALAISAIIAYYALKLLRDVSTSLTQR